LKSGISLTPLRECDYPRSVHGKLTFVDTPPFKDAPRSVRRELDNRTDGQGGG
jgi:hypothetical protein